MLNVAEHSTSGTCRKMSLVPNGGLGSGRKSGSTKKLFITPFVVHGITNEHSSKRNLKEKRLKLS